MQLNLECFPNRPKMFLLRRLRNYLIFCVHGIRKTEQECIPVGCVPYGRSLTVCYSLLPGGSAPGGVCSQRGCLLLGGSAPRGGVCSWGEGVWSWRGGGGSAGGVGASQHALRQTPPPVDRILDTRL